MLRVRWAGSSRRGREVEAARRDTGFLLVTGHGVDATMRDDAERLFRELLPLPDDVRRRSR